MCYIYRISISIVLHIGNVNKRLYASILSGNEFKTDVAFSKLSWPALPNGFKRKHVEPVWDQPTDIHNG